MAGLPLNLDQAAEWDGWWWLPGYSLLTACRVPASEAVVEL